MTADRLSTPAPMAAAARSARKVLLAVACFSAAVNILMLTLPVYMLQVFDRVLSSQSSETLVLLSGIALIALGVLGALDIFRGLMLGRLGSWIERKLGGYVIEASAKSAVVAGGPTVQGLRDLATIRSFLSGPAAFPLLDFPWTPLFLIVVFLIHPLLGGVALAGALLLLTLAALHEFSTRGLLKEAGGASIENTRNADAAILNADAIQAMGMLPAIVRRWHLDGRAPAALHQRAAFSSAVVGGLAKFLRLSLQVGILAFGALLVIGGELTGGGMIAASILMGRALAPIEMAISGWRSAVGAFAAYRRVHQQLAASRSEVGRLQLPQPVGNVRLDGVTFVYPGQSDPMLFDLNFALEAGDSIGVVGPSAAGKTTLARLLVGNLSPRFGDVRLDGAEISQWPAEDRGRYIGYLPQDVELFAGTVGANIARMGEPDERVIDAAKFVDAHEMILDLPDGYETLIGDRGHILSGGQRQWIALARAVYGDPCLVVLDEPNASLDQNGETALIGAIRSLASRGATVVVIGHRPNILQHVDKILLLQKGKVRALGSRQDVLPRLISPASSSSQPAPLASRA